MPDSAPRVPGLPVPDVPWRPGSGPPPHRPRPTGTDRELFLHGADLFDRTCWWEAHEVWEVLWVGAARGSAERTALQALIQTAAWMLKRDDPRAERAAHTLRSRALERLDEVISTEGPQFLGADLGALRDALATLHPGQALAMVTREER